MTLRRSWIDSANAAGGDFPVNNLPYGVFSVGDGPHRCGVAIGDLILDVATLEAEGTLVPHARPVLQSGQWNDFMALGAGVWATYRAALMARLSEGADVETRDSLKHCLVDRAKATLHLPMRVSEYTDFYSSRHHAFNVGSMFRGPQNALPPNWLHMPIGYNGRASSVVVSGTPVQRPTGQLIDAEDAPPFVGPSQRFDFELEMGAIVGQPSQGPLTASQAFGNIFGYVLLNDWSARDIQRWEYQPLGPFQSKATATTISPWIVTAEALVPFRTDTPAREVPLLPYLEETKPMLYDISLEVGLAPDGAKETVISRTNFKEMYFSSAQQLAHHTSSGCPMRVGDLLGSGTISGPTPDSRGSLLELSWGGQEPFTIGSGRSRRFLEDGDQVILRGHAQGDGYRIGFGDCSGKVLPA